MDTAQAKRVLEAILFVFGQPIALKRLCEIIPETDPARMRQLIETLNAEYVAAERAFRIQEVAGGYQLVTDQTLAPWIKRALQTPRPDSVSAASLETLAIIAYRQPITKAEIEAIRGVDVGGALETLTERQFIRVAGRKESPGRPFLYGTTAEFLRHFGLKSLEALPTVAFPTIQEPAAAPEASKPEAAETAAPEGGTPPSPASQPQPGPEGSTETAQASAAPDAG